MAEGGFDFKKLIDDSKNVLLNPKGYFTTMAKTGGFAEPILKALIYGIIAGIINLIWSLLHVSVASMLGGLFGAGAGAAAILIGAILFAVIGLFIGGIIVLIISSICGGNTNFEANTRVVAAIMVLSPINALLGILSVVSFYLAAVISLVVSLYGIYLLYQALVNALTAKQETSKVISIILAIIPVLMLISSLVCVSAANKFGNKMMEGLPDSKQVEELQDKVKELQDMQNKSE